MRIAPFLSIPLALATSGCISTAATIVKAPFQVAGKAIDWTTTSQDEADRNYGRKMRKQEAKEGRERKQAAERCRKHPDDTDACRYSGYRAGY
ncbi:hypothetical protein LPN01_07125 [Sphingomonas sp. A2-49]|uniref:hypothetical protein n=1 Tax=Sphingomonas sp. A2-49 TaxID=1391375 RepID=UPI0021D0409D|nr:hypothetical protein [Sphingomonas sp. A2-49]MCU6453846.1 hypothetical protein [Sphingomonas sp. A2-49]